MSYILKLKSNSTGQLLYFFGAQHTNDPNHPQFTALKKLWGEFLNVEGGGKGSAG